METVSQDKDADLSYWLDMSAVVGSRTMSAVVVDPDSELSGIAVISMGVNPSDVTDEYGVTIAAGKAIGIKIAGGSPDQAYDVVMRMTLDSGDQDDRTLRVLVTEK